MIHGPGWLAGVGAGSVPNWAERFRAAEACPASNGKAASRRPRTLEPERPKTDFMRQNRLIELLFASLILASGINPPMS